jgi:hypothetical protein
VKEKQGKENEDEQDRSLAGVVESRPTSILPPLGEIQHGEIPYSVLSQAIGRILQYSFGYY